MNNLRSLQMIEVKTTQASLHVFLSLTGNAFMASREPGCNEDYPQSFYWAMRWLAREVLGTSWWNWTSQIGN